MSSSSPFKMAFLLKNVRQVINTSKLLLSPSCYGQQRFASTVPQIVRSTPSSISSSVFHHSPVISAAGVIITLPQRTNTVFTSVQSDLLWEGVTGPRGSTKKRARGKRRVTRPKIDLHRGQRLGMGKAQMEWPGLNSSLYRNFKIRDIQKVNRCRNFR